MKKIIFICLILFISKPGLSQNGTTRTLTGKISFISSQHVYVQFENTSGLASGDTLYITKNKKYIPKLVIKSLSSRSCAAMPFENNLSKGIEVVGFVKETKTEEKIEDSKPILSNAEVEQRTDEINEYNGFNKFDRGLYGRFSVSGYSNLSNITGRNDYQNWRYSLSVNADNLNNSRFSLFNYFTFRYRADEWNFVKSNLGEAFKVYELGVKYDFDKSTNLILGRKINRRVTNIGAVDGIQLETNYKNFVVGAILGSRPDYNNYGFNSSLLQFGGYVNRSDSIGQGLMQNTIAIMQQMNNNATDRRFLYLQHSNNVLANTSIFLSSEFDLFEKIQNKSNNELRFTSLYLSLRYSPVRWFSSSLSYDARKNVIYFETFKNYAEELLESALRQGFKFRVNFRPIKYVFANVYSGYRFREGDIKPTRNLGGSVTHSRIPYLNLSANFNVIKLTTNYMEGNIFGIRFSRDFINGILYSSIGYKKVDYKFLSSNSTLMQDIIKFDLSFRFSKRYSMSINLENTFENKISYSNIYFNFTTRF